MIYYDEAADKICSLFGEVVLPDRLHIVSKVTEEDVFEIFHKDTQEIVYKTDENGKVEGIVTFGAFLRNYGQGQPWLNIDFCYVEQNAFSEDKVRNIFDNNKKIIRIPVLDEEKKVCFEIRRFKGADGKEDRRKQLIPFAKLRNRNIPCLFVRRPEFLEGYLYTEKEQERIKQGLSFSKMQEDPGRYEEEFRDVLGQNYSLDYVKKLSQIPPVIKENGRVRHMDRCSELVNVIGGQRVTIGTPEQSNSSIHVYGRCGVFGYAVEDIQTIPSQLQKLCNQDGRSMRVENHGIWGTDEFLSNLLLDIEEGLIREADIVLVYAMTDAWWYRKELEEIAVYCWDTTEEFHEFLARGNTFYEIPGHMTAEGYSFIASFIYEKMKNEKVFERTAYKGEKNSENIGMKSEHMTREIEAYLGQIKKSLPIERLNKGKTGAIVMNCNPFTLGHRYLIENAGKSVDYLLIFVVEEDKSFFSFPDRIEMVRQGTKDIPHVYVVPSGNYILSALTFPGYFLKEQNPDMKINVTDDARIFGKYIAPALHISVRFAGTEPIDKVTAQYHMYLKRYLEEYGVEFCEIPRRQIGEEYISASMVRKLLKEEKFEQIKQYVPVTTFAYLQKLSGNILNNCV